MKVSSLRLLLLVHLKKQKREQSPILDTTVPYQDEDASQMLASPCFRGVSSQPLLQAQIPFPVSLPSVLKPYPLSLSPQKISGMEVSEGGTR